MANGSVVRVWAPTPERVELQLGAMRQTMRHAGGGWWTTDRELEAGTDYGFVLDGEGPFPDPRSGFQPFGVNGLSRTVDHTAFRWTDGRWQPPPLSSAVLYELHVGTFTRQGTFDGVGQRLDHLLELGITHVELMPVCEFPGSRGWGYDGVDLYAPHHAYGGPDGLKRLVDACHHRGLAVVLDVVYNHLGPVGNFLGRFGPYFTRRHETPWGAAVNFDGADSGEVRAFFCDNALMWLRDYHVDGLRLDAVHAIIDTSATHFLAQLAHAVDELRAATGRHFVLIAESDLNDVRIVQPPEAGGYGIDAQWSDDFHHALHAVLTGERSGYYADFGTLSHLARAFRNVFVYAGTYSVYRRRVHGRPLKGCRGSQFIVSAQNHDQVGNRPKGERLTHLTSPGRLYVAAALMVTAPFVPLLFQGEEWGASSPFLYFTSHDDPELSRLVHERRQNEVLASGGDPLEVPHPQSEESFSRSCLPWAEIAEEPHRALLDWYRAVIRLRNATPALRNGRYDQCDVQADERASTFVVRRDDIVVVCNLGQTACRVPLSIDGVVLLASSPDIELRNRTVTLPADSVAIVAGISSRAPDARNGLPPQEASLT